MFQRFKILLACVLLLCGLPVHSFAVTPESPEVKQVVEKALKWLETQVHDKVGGKCLIGLSLYKAGRPVSHPKIVEAVEACKKTEYGGLDNYSHGIAIMFMCEIDPDKLRPEIEKARDALLKKQIVGCGGWSYPAYTTGDTSQTQYAVLAMWMCESNGIPIPVSAMDDVANWLIRTQDPSGAWGYQGNDPKNFNRTTQSGVQGSLAAAGLSSAYIMGDVLQLIEIPEAQTTSSALKEVKEKEKVRKRAAKTDKVDVGQLRRCLADGDKWFNEKFTPQEFNSLHWKHYCMYAIERYRSFRELSERKFEKEPKWYNDGFVFLRDTQEKEGSWESKEDKIAATAFGVLFLMRSAKKAIAKIVGNLGDGVMLGGMGLPPNVADLRERNGKVVESKLTGSIDELIAMISDDSNPELSRFAESTQAIALDKDVTKRAGQITRLRALVSAPAFESRLVAVRSLGKVRDLENVPILLYALSDPDIRVVREADKALRFISRRLEGMGQTDELTKAQQLKLQLDWRKWYLGIRPDAELLD